MQSEKLCQMQLGMGEERERGRKGHVDETPQNVVP